MMIEFICTLNPEDTALIRKTLKENNLKVKRCQLGNNRLYVLVHTDDNRKAVDILFKLGYTLNPIYETKNDLIFQNDKMMLERRVIKC